MMSAREICLALKGKWFSSYGLAYCPVHGNSVSPALSIADGANGKLLVKCHSVGCSFKDIMGALKDLGLETGGALEFDPDELARRNADVTAFKEKRLAQAAAIWAETEPIEDTLAEYYLRNRAIRCDLPDCLRYHRECWHQYTARCYPALVALVSKPGLTSAIHRTYLRRPGLKIDHPEPRAMLGECKGGGVVLSVGSGPLVAAEGIETSLSILDAFFEQDLNLIATLSTSGTIGLALPFWKRKLVVCPDRDPIDPRTGDRPGEAAADKLIERATAKKWEARKLMPPGDFDDWNSSAMALEQEEANA